MAGASQLGYIGFEVKDADAWERFAVDVLGLGLVERSDDGTRAFRMDGHRQRVVVHPGEADDLVYLGWQFDDADSLTATVTQLRAAGVEVIDGTPEEAARRRVAKLVKLQDPSGTPLELFYGPQMAPKDEPFSSPLARSGFVADERGLGHVVITARDQAASQKFYCELLGFRLSDRITAEIHGYHADIVFLHANPRHHSLALGNPSKKRIHHFMLEVRSMDDVGLGFDRSLKSGVRIMQTLGRHPNDRMFSFYARTPSGFQFEYGWGGREVDDNTWQPTTYDHISEWGHHPPQFLAPTPTDKGKTR
jgi:2,3-dihydroxybiphenyl 1,2-dioxygenase